MEQAYKIGLAAGAALAAIAIVVIMLMKKSKKVSHFDERQKLARGRAYKAGYFTLITYMFLYGITDAVGLIWCDTLTGLCIGLIMGVAAFSIAAIHDDAFLALDENIRSWSMLSVIITVINLAVAVINSIRGRAIAAEGLTFYSINYFVAGLFVLIFISLMIRNSRTSREEDEE